MDHYQEEYIPLIEEFVTQVEQSGVQTDGIPEPHLPVIGKNYEQCKYKIAFFGIDTKGWNELSDFIIDWHSDPQQALYGWKKPLDEMEYLKWCNNFHTSFWDFVIQFLCEFYHISSPEEYENYADIGTSFVWGNTNAIEKYDNVKDSGVKEEDYDIVKNYSRIFDSADHVLKPIRPNVLIVLNWSEAEEWLTKFEDKSDVLRIELDTHLLYYYIRSSNTHVFWTAHPRWLSKEIHTMITKIIQKIREYNVWDILPEKPSDWCLPMSQDSNQNTSHR